MVCSKRWLRIPSDSEAVIRNIQCPWFFHLRFVAFLAVKITILVILVRNGLIYHLVIRSVYNVTCMLQHHKTLNFVLEVNRATFAW